jgi:hypothetical protein
MAVITDHVAVKVSIRLCPSVRELILLANEKKGIKVAI